MKTTEIATEADLRIVFDPQIFCHIRYGGIARYISSLALELYGMEGVCPLILAPFHFNEYLDGLPQAIVRGRRVRALEGLTAIAYGASILPAKWQTRRLRPDVLHNTYYFPVRPPRGTRAVLTVHDMIHELYPQFFLASPFIRRIKAASIKAADHVICVSESTRRDVLKIYNLPEDKVSVIHHGFSALKPIQTTGADVLRQKVMGRNVPYLLYVGSRVNYKNFRGLVEAYASSGWLKNHFDLLCFGGGTFTPAERANMAQLGVSAQVHWTGGSDAELASCYQHAAIYVCPSLYEGFGIPLLESMSLGCPVACSSTSSLPEVAAEAAAFFDPADTASIASVLEATLGSTSVLAHLKRRGHQRAQRFSWHRCAEQTLQVYRHTVGRR